MSVRTVKECIYILGVEDISVLEGCADLQEEFKILKKSYMKRALATHPDKGGDSEAFREVQTSYEVIREICDAQKVASLTILIKASGRGSSSSRKSTRKPTGNAKSRKKKSKMSSTKKGKFSGEDGEEEAKDRRSDAYDIPEDGAFNFEEFARKYEEKYNSYDSKRQPSWDFYENAVGVDTCPYRIERAKSGRSTCKARGTKDFAVCDGLTIQLGELRCGAFDEVNGGYGSYGWSRLKCWRVPSRIWVGFEHLVEKGITDVGVWDETILKLENIVLQGYVELTPSERLSVQEHFMNRQNWAKKRGSKRIEAPVEEDAEPKTKREAKNKLEKKTPARGKDVTESSVVVSNSSHGSGSEAMVPAPQSTAVTHPGNKYIPPKPGVNGAPHGALAGKTVVMTGVFPEIGGGAGLTLGKDRLKTVLTNLGARVTSSVSGKTDILMVGKSPGMSKISQARQFENPHGGLVMWDLRDLKERVEGGFGAINTAPKEKMEITNFSAGYTFQNGASNSLALRASEEQKAIAMGYKEAPLMIKGRAGKKRKIKSAEKSSDEMTAKAIPGPDPELLITCDTCGVACSEISYFINEGGGVDVCEDCIDLLPKERRAVAVRQFKGTDAPETKKKSKKSRSSK